MRIVSFLIFLLILLPFSGMGQPGNPNDPDAQVEQTQSLSGNPANAIDGGGGQIPGPWANPNLARIQDDAYATLTTTANNQTTNYLLAQNFGFNIPAGSIIKGIIVQVDRYATGGLITDNKVSLIDATGTIGAHNESSPFPWLSTDLDIPQLYGGILNTWGVSNWTADKINNANFGVAIMAQTSNQSTTFNLYVDEVRVTVFFLAGGARYAVSSGNWNSISSWSTTPGGAAGASLPTSASDVFIGGGFTIIQNVNGATCNSLNIGTSQTTPTGRLTFDADSRNMVIGPGGLNINSNGNVLSSFTPTVNVAGNVIIDAVLTNQSFLLTINSASGILSGSGTVGRLNIQSFTTHTGTLTVTKEITGGALRLINGSSAHLTYSGTTNNLDNDVLSLITDGNTMEFSQTLSDATNFDIQEASDTFYNLIISGNAPKYYNGDITINGDLTITSTGILNNQNQNGITLSGNWTNNNGANGFVPNSCSGCIVIFSGGNAQTITNTSGEQFYRVTVSKAAQTIVTAANDIVIDNQLSLISGQFNVGSNSLLGTANTIMNGGNLIIGTTGSTVPALTGTYTLTSGIITFNGAGSQTIRSTTSSPAITAYKTVEFTGSGTKSISGPIVVDTDLKISASAVLDVTASDFGINIRGDWTNTSTFVPRNGTVTFGGTASLYITNPAGAIYNNLTINNSALSSAVILNDPVSVSGLLTFIDGHIISSDTSLLSLGVNASVASASDASHVVGPVAKDLNTAVIFAFPIGSGTVYMPVSITPTTTDATTLMAQYFSLEQPVGTTELGIDHVSGQDYWTVQRTSGSGDVAVTLVWKYPSAADAEVNNLAELLVAQWDGANWVSRGNAGTTGTFVDGSVKSNAISSFTQPYFVIGSSTANNPLSNYRYFAPSTGNWNSAGVWSYRPGGPTNASVPTSTKLVVIPAGTTVNISDFPPFQATKSMRSLSILGTINLNNAIGQDIILNVGDHGLTLGPSGDITGSDAGDQIQMSGSIVLDNTSNISHPLIETNFLTQGNTITGSGGNLPILNVNMANQTFTGSTSFKTLVMGTSNTNNGTITVTGGLTGGGILTNNTTGTIIWQGTTAADNVIDATPPGNTVQLVNNTGGNLDIDDFVVTKNFNNLILGGANNFLLGTDVNITGDLTILPGATFNISSNENLNLLGNWINDGTFNATSGTVEFNGTTTISGTSTNNFNHILIGGALTPSGTLNLRGNFTNNGSFVAGTGTVVFNGTAKQTITGSAITTFNNISITNSSVIPAVQIQSDQNMTGVLTLSSFCVLDADGSSDDKIFTLLSSADNLTIDASIAALPSGAFVTGDVTVQRYMSLEGNNSGRIYRYISSPVQNAPVSQIQTFIPVTGTFAGSSVCSGCGTNQSMFLYDETVITDINGSGAANSNDGYLNFPAASNTETFEPGRGYSIFVRANIDPISTAGSALWSLHGPINFGNVSLPVSFSSSGTGVNDGWNLVGNPYPSTIDWDAGGWTRTNLDNTTYMLDNGLGSPVYATYVVGGASANGGTRYIATGQAFFVKSDGGSPSLQATEAVKTSGTQTTFFRTASIPDIMRVTLRQGTRADETVIQFKPGASKGFDAISDAHKLDNPVPMYSLATVTDGVRYVINALPVPTSKTEVPLDITSAAAGSYSLEFTEFESFANPLMPIMLRDDFLGSITDIRTHPKYTFQVTSDAASFDHRFTIEFGTTMITGLETLDASHIIVYPNPAKSSVNVEVKSDNEVSAKVISITGTTLLEKNLEGSQVKKGSFNLEEQADGIYILIIQDGVQQFQKKIFKIK